MLARSADSVRLDYTGLNGSEPSTINADTLLTGLEALLPGFDATHHHVAVMATADDTGDLSTDEVVNGTATWRAGIHQPIDAARQRIVAGDG